MDTAASKVKIALRLRLPLLSLFVLLIAAFVLPDRVWNTLLVGLGGMFVVAYGWVWYLAQGLEAKRQTESHWVAVGDVLAETFEVWNHSLVPALWVQVMDESNVPGYQAAVVRSPGNERIDRWRQTAVCQQRGQYLIGPWSIRTGDPFGIFIMTRHYPQTHEIIIHPPIHSRLPISLPAGHSSGRKRARQRSYHATLNAATTRPYTPGDALRLIHWPTTARRDELFVREFDLDATGNIWIVLDMQASAQVGRGMMGTEEQMVLMAAALAARAQRQNRAVGLAGYGRRPTTIPAGQGQGQLWRILRALALIRADGQTDLAAALYDLGHIADRGSAAILITSTADASWIPQLLHLAQQGIESTVILLDRPSFGGHGNPHPICDAVHHLGLNCLVIHQGDIGLPDIVPRQKTKLRITPLGKAVEVS